MNTQLVDSLVQVILSLDQEERTLLEKKLFFDREGCSRLESISNRGVDESEPSTPELMQIAQTGNSFDFLQDEPDIYSLKDGEPL